MCVCVTVCVCVLGGVLSVLTVYSIDDSDLLLVRAYRCPSCSSIGQAHHKSPILYHY